MLVGEAGHKGPPKIANRWSSDVYIINEQPDSKTPVYRIVKENGKCVCTLHRIMLLPVSFLTAEVVQARKEQRRPWTRLSQFQSSDSDQTDSFDSSFGDYVPVPKALDKSNHDQAQEVNTNQENNPSVDSEILYEDIGAFAVEST